MGPGDIESALAFHENYQLAIAELSSEQGTQTEQALLIDSTAQEATMPD